MGAHKYNPVAIAAKEGKLPPKEKPKMSKRQQEAWMRKMIEDKTGITTIRQMLGGRY